MLLKALACFLLLATISAKHFSINSNLQISEVSPSLIPHLKDSVATANYSDDHMTTGWAQIQVQTSGAYPDSNQTYSAGYLEGYLTYDLIYASNKNKGIALLEKGFQKMPKKAGEFIQNQTNWINEQAKTNPNDNYWSLVNATISQLYGLYDGFVAAVNHFNKTEYLLSFDEFYTTLTYAVDLPDVVSKYSIVDLHLPRCSFLLKLTDDGLFTGHTTWSDYTDMVRLYKIYDFNLQNPLVKNKKISFSSIPGAIASEDDFYIVDNNKVVCETTLVAYNPFVYSFLHYDSVPYWIRVTVANLVFTDQQSWADSYFTHRSGTYNNQWLIVDFNSYNTYKNDLTQAKNIIWFIEEFYHLTSTIDVTQELLIKQGYVASYNSPYNQTIWSLSKNIDHYDNNPRGNLFKKYAPQIKTLEDLQSVLRMNNHTDTKLYCLAIASRCDLQDLASLPFGAIDCKVTSDKLVGNHQAYIQNGPTTYENLPPFNWTDWPKFNKKLVNMPNQFNFGWTFVDPTQSSFESVEFGRFVGKEFLQW